MHYCEIIYPSSPPIPSILVNRFGSRDGDDLFRGDELYQLDSIVSSHPHGSPPASQISLSDEFQRPNDTVMSSSIPFSQLDCSPRQEEYERFND